MGGPPPAGIDQIEKVFSSVVSAMVGLGFIVLLVMVLTAGFKYLMSGGEPKAIQQAHQTALWAVLGIVFMALAWLVLQLIKVFTGIDVTVFSVKI